MLTFGVLDAFPDILDKFPSVLHTFPESLNTFLTFWAFNWCMHLAWTN